MRVRCVQHRMAPTALRRQNKGLFQRAIMVSSSSFGSGFGNLVEAQAAYNSITSATGCYYAIDSLQCLRECTASLNYPTTFYPTRSNILTLEVPFETINSSLTTLPLPQFQPMLDGDILRNSPSLAYGHTPSLIAPIDLLLRCKSNEGMSDALGAKQVINNATQFSAFITAFLGLNSTMLS